LTFASFALGRLARRHEDAARYLDRPDREHKGAQSSRSPAELRRACVANQMRVASLSSYSPSPKHPIHAPTPLCWLVPSSVQELPEVVLGKI